MMKMALASSALLLSLTQTGVAAPLCSDHNADPDLDGWGWENGSSCRVISSAVPSPSTAQSCVDTAPIGDGWGWDGVSSCLVDAPLAALDEPAPDAASCVDTDPPGDGWGWDGVSSCRVVEPVESMPLTPAASAAICIDTDPTGDGWGWDGSQSCRVVDTPSAPLEGPEPEVAAAASECVDTDPIGDGWGWNGSTSCRVEADDPVVASERVTSAPATTPETDTLVCVDTDPLNDGWGWNGVTSCRVEPAKISQPEPVSASNEQAWVAVNSADGSRATGRHESGAVSLNGKMYLLGGRGNRPVDVYDRSANQWYQLGNLPMEMHHFQPVAYNGKIYVIGAMTCCFPNESTIDNIWIMDPADGSWEPGAAIPVDRRRGSAAAVVYNHRIYLIGGNTRGHSGGAVAWFDEFDPATGRWRTLADAPNARDHAGAAVVDGRLVISSGRQTSQPDTFGNTVAATDVYDFASGRWSSAANIPTPRGGAMFATNGRDYLVIGGESNAQYNAHDEVEAFNVTNGTWRRLPSLLTGRHSGGAAVLGDGVHVVAGAANRGGGSEISAHERLNLAR